MEIRLAMTFKCARVISANFPTEIHGSIDKLLSMALERKNERVKRFVFIPNVYLCSYIAFMRGLLMNTYSYCDGNSIESLMVVDGFVFI